MSHRWDYALDFDLYEPHHLLYLMRNLRHFTQKLGECFSKTIKVLHGCTALHRGLKPEDMDVVIFVTTTRKLFDDFGDVIDEGYRYGGLLSTISYENRNWFRAPGVIIIRLKRNNLLCFAACEFRDLTVGETLGGSDLLVVGYAYKKASKTNEREKFSRSVIEYHAEKIHIESGGVASTSQVKGILETASNIRKKLPVYWLPGHGPDDEYIAEYCDFVDEEPVDNMYC